VLLACLVLATAGCGDDRLQADAAQEQYRATATVLESPDHGPELCLGGQADSYPPQCGGVPITNWDWDAVDDEESANGTTWGFYSVVGSFDGTSLTLTEPPQPPDDSEAGPAREPLVSPCPEPDPAAGDAPTGQEAVGPAVELARAQPDHAGLWLTGDVLNAAFTGDLERHRAQLREVWGGPLCLVEHARTLTDLRAVQDELFSGAAAELGLEALFASTDEVGNVVELGVIAVDDAQRAALDARYGTGTVRVVPGLRVELR
jgi:truncated hemoglobin YjbI